MLAAELAGGREYPPEILEQTKSQLLKTQSDFDRERDDLAEHLKQVIISDDDIASIEQAYAEIRDGLNAATVEDKRRYFDLLDGSGRIALEQNEKVVYVKC